MDIGLTKQQKDTVRASWNKFMANSVVNGTAFYMSMFKTYPAMYAVFKPLFKDLSIDEVKDTAKFKGQVRVFNDAITSYVDNLDDVECLTTLVQKFASNHFKRGISVKDVNDAYGIFVKYLQDALHIDAATKQAWDRIIVVICHITEAYKKEVSA